MVLILIAFHIATIVAATALVTAAAINDSRHYKIPNIICGMLIFLFPLYVLTFPPPRSIDWQQNIIVFTFVLLSGFGMFLSNLAGAGDIKFLAAVSLWAGPHLIAFFIVITAIAGGILALAMVGVTHFRNRTARVALPIARVPIPYGIAIAVGGLSTFYLMSLPILFPS